MQARCRQCDRKIIDHGSWWEVKGVTHSRMELTPNGDRYERDTVEKVTLCSPDCVAEWAKDAARRYEDDFDRLSRREPKTASAEEF